MSVGGKGPAAERLRDLRTPVCGYQDMSIASRGMLTLLHAYSYCSHYELYLHGPTLLVAAEKKVGPVEDAFSRQALVRAFVEADKAGRLQPRGPQAWALVYGRVGFETVPGVLPPREWLFERDCWRCRYCMKEVSGSDAHLDHVFPRSRGGWDDAANVVAACRRCNTEKGARTPEEWAVHDPSVRALP